MPRFHFLVLTTLLLFSLSAETSAGNTLPVLNPNTATVEQISVLPGMNQTLAEALVAKRPYPSMTALDDMLSDHLDRKARQSLYEHLFVPIDLNTARAAEIRLIPDMSRKMVHEFEEYRPYTSLAQFRREIGKYVDEDEVARLSRYVTIGDD